MDEVLSVGDYVLSGGELPAMIIADAVTRLLPGVLNNENSSKSESHAVENDALLEHPHYTRPATWRGYKVPEVLLGGHHKQIAEWRRKQSIQTTAQIRPELLHHANLTSKERAEVESLCSKENLL